MVSYFCDILLFTEQFNLYVWVCSKLIWTTKTSSTPEEVNTDNTLLRACVNDLLSCKKLPLCLNLKQFYSLIQARSALKIILCFFVTCPHCKNGKDIISLAPLLEEQTPAWDMSWEHVQTEHKLGCHYILRDTITHDFMKGCFYISTEPHVVNTQCTHIEHTWGNEHTMQYMDDVLYNHTPWTYIILLTSISPIHLIKITFWDHKAKI